MREGIGAALKGALLALLMAGPALAEDYALPSPPSTGTRVDYWADKAEFDESSSTLHLIGNVTMKMSTMTVKGQDIWIDNASRTGRSDKPFFVEDGASAIYGKSGDFDFAKHSSNLKQPSSGTGDWRIHAREAQMSGDRRLKYWTADFTSCDNVPPHYHFHASSVKVVPKKYLFAKNTLFYLGKIPVFYMPFFYKSLNPTHTLRWRLQPGYDKQRGFYVKGTLTTQWTDSIYTKLYDDYYSNQGFGYGGELGRNAGMDSRGSVFGYKIKEAGTVKNRWGYFGGGYQTLVPSVSFQGRLQFQSDPLFTNDYIRSDIFRLTPELINSAALTKIFSNGTVRVAYVRQDIWDPSNSNKFIKNTESRPRVEAQSNSFRLWKTPWLNTLSGFAEDNYTLSRLYNQRSMGGSWTGTNSFLVARGVSFTPSLTYSETYYNRFDTFNYEPAVTNQNLESFIGRWTASETLRFGTPLGDIDATHAYTKRLKPNSITEDTGPVDKGVEQNQIILTDIFMPAPRMWARVSGSYDFSVYRDRILGYRERVRPVTVDLSWQSSKTLIATLHNDYKPGEGNRATIADVRWGEATGLTLGGSVGYNLTSPGTYYQSIDIGYSPSSGTWRLEVGLRSLVVSRGGFGPAQRGRIFEKEFIWSNRWHDFFTKLIVRVRPRGVGEITGRIDFRFGAADPKQAKRHDWEAEWFPGRKKDEEIR